MSVLVFNCLDLPTLDYVSVSAQMQRQNAM